MAWYVRKSWQLAPPDDHAAVCRQRLFQCQVDCFLHLNPFILCQFQIKIRGNLVAIIIRYQFQHLDSCSECQYASLGERQGLDLTITSYFVSTSMSYCSSGFTWWVQVSTFCIIVLVVTFAMVVTSAWFLSWSSHQPYNVCISRTSSYSTLCSNSWV